ncbi:MAG: MAPEG family protein [Methyloceanibacter sp.]
MTVPIWVLLAFVVWTILVLLAGIGVHRLSRILSGQAKPTDFPGGAAEGPPAYRRAVRAHANCVENLPLFAAIALTAAVAGIDTPRLDQLAIAVLVARICQTLTHMLFAETSLTVGLRFVFFTLQLLAMFWMAAIVAVTAVSASP